nr:oxidoreductase [Actinomycetota bacterium]
MSPHQTDVDIRPAPPVETDQALLIRRVATEARGVISLELAALDGSPLPPWTPGAHLSLRLESGLVREYSLCGDPRD